jgi:thymidine phosphorylase
VGEKVAEGDKLLTLFGASDELLQRNVERVAAAWEIGTEKPELPPLASHVLTHEHGLEDYTTWRGRN